MEKCAWCSRRSSPLEEVRVNARDWYCGEPRAKLYHICPRHREAFSRFKAYELRFGCALLVLSFMPLLVIVPSHLAGSAVGVAVGLLGVAILLFLFPFTDPGTQQALGARWSALLVRVGALIPVAGAVHVLRSGL